MITGLSKASFPSSWFVWNLNTSPLVPQRQLSAAQAQTCSTAQLVQASAANWDSYVQWRLCGYGYAPPPVWHVWHRMRVWVGVRAVSVWAGGGGGLQIKADWQLKVELYRRTLVLAPERVLHLCTRSPYRPHLATYTSISTAPFD
jgi:hypothetical protein